MAASVLWYVARRRLARHGPATLGLILLVAIASGAVMGLVAGARRTTQAFPRFVEHSRAEGDLTVFAQLDDDVPFEADDQAALKQLLDVLPEVERSARATYLITQAVDRAGREQRLLALTMIDPGQELAFGRPHIVEGSWPSDTDAGAVAVDEELAARAGLEVGSRYRLTPFTLAQFGPAGEGADIDPNGPPTDLRVAAIYRYPLDLQPVDLDQGGIYADRSEMQLTPAYWERYGPDLARYGVGTKVTLAAGVTAADLEAALQERIPGRFELEQPMPTGGDIDGIDRTITLQARGLVVVGVVTGATGLGLLWLVFARLAASDRGQDEALVAIGLGPRDRAVLASVEGFVVGTAAAAIAVVGAWASSALMPFGVARRAELDLGLRADPWALGVGALVTVGAVTVVQWLTVRRLDGRTAGPAQRSRISTAASNSGLPPSAIVGLGFALRPEGAGGSIPVRTAFVGVAVAGTVIASTLGLDASLDLVRAEPERRGAYWDAAVGNLASTEAGLVAMDTLDANPDIAAYAGESFFDVTIDGEIEPILAHFAGKGDLEPLVVAGRPPVADDEIALGKRIMDRLDVGIGDTVEARMSAAPVELRVVGQALADDVEGATGGPGKSGSMTESALASLHAAGRGHAGPTWLVVRFADGVEPDAALARLERDFPQTATTPRLPTDLRNLERLGGLVVLLAVLVGLLGVGVALVALLGSVSRRRSELAVLRTLGFVRRQAAATIIWQATTIAVIGLGAGVPIGMALGRWGWTTVADGLGIVPAPVLTPLPLLALLVGGIVLLNLAAAAPARIARRLRPADVLREE